MTKCPSCSYNYPDGCDATCEYKHPMVEWISVKDSLPAMNKKVLGVNQFNEMGVCCRTKFWESEPPEWRIEEGILFFPTHWMPLPEPPKEIK